MISLPVCKSLYSSNLVSLGSKPETSPVPLSAACVIVEVDGYEFHDRRAQTHTSVHSVNPSWNQVRTRVSLRYTKANVTLPEDFSVSRQHPAACRASAGSKSRLCVQTISALNTISRSNICAKPNPSQDHRTGK